MAGKSPPDWDLKIVLTLAFLAYHAFAVYKDAKTVERNWNRVKRNPSLDNVARLTLAAGVLAADF